MMAVFSLSRDEPTVYPINASWWPGDLRFQAINRHGVEQWSYDVAMFYAIWD